MSGTLKEIYDRFKEEKSVSPDACATDRFDQVSEYKETSNMDIVVFGGQQ